MAANMFYLHITTVILFLIFFTFKTFLLLINKNSTLDRIRNKTKLVDIILGALLLASGIYLLIVIGNTQTYMIAKIILVCIAVPLGIVGLKKNNKLLSVLSLGIFVYVYAIAGTKNLALDKENYELDGITFQYEGGDGENEILKATESATLQQGKVIFKVLCVECHGEDGQKDSSNPANLAKSSLSLEEKAIVITNGRGEMMGFDAELSEHEIELVAAYTETLQQ